MQSVYYTALADFKSCDDAFYIDLTKLDSTFSFKLKGKIRVFCDNKIYLILISFKKIIPKFNVHVEGHFSIVIQKEIDLTYNRDFDNLFL